MAGGLITNYINKGSGAPSVAPSVPTGESAYYYDETNGDLYVYNTTSTAWHLALSGVFSGEVSGTDLKATGLTGTALSVRLRGGNASGAPSTGTGVVRDLAVNSDGSIYICTTAGSPGTWTAVSGGGGGGSSTLAGDSDVTINSPATHDILQYSGSTWANVQGGIVHLDEKTGSGQTTFSFTTINQNYRHLQLYVYGRSDNAAQTDLVTLRFNGDTGANYDFNIFFATNSAGISENFAQTSITLATLSAATAPTGAAAGFTIDIPMYAGSTFQKALTTMGGTKQGTSTGLLVVREIAGWWRNTAAITQIDLICGSGHWLAGSVATLYGLV